MFITFFDFLLSRCPLYHSKGQRKAYFLLLNVSQSFEFISFLEFDKTPLQESEPIFLSLLLNTDVLKTTICRLSVAAMHGIRKPILTFIRL